MKIPKAIFAQTIACSVKFELPAKKIMGFRFLDEYTGTDGCSIPTYAAPLKSIALGFARLATGQGLAPERAKAAKRVITGAA